MEKTEEMLCYLEHIERDLYDSWSKEIGAVINRNLESPLLRTVNGLLVVNFGAEVST